MGAQQIEQHLLSKDFAVDDHAVAVADDELYRWRFWCGVQVNFERINCKLDRRVSR